MISIANPIYDVVFKYLMEDDRKVLNIDDTKYAGDSDMEHIVHRLLKAATNAKVRQDMNIEEEFFSAIERRDTEILNRDYELAKQKVQIQEQSNQIQEQSNQIQEQSNQLQEQSNRLRKSIQLFLKSGMSDAAIAAELGISLQEVEELK